MKTKFAKKEDFYNGTCNRSWWIVDAESKTLGRLATRIADTLRGKHKVIFSPHVDTGDFVIVVNAEKILVSGNKDEDKMYYRHTGYPGGIKNRSAGAVLDGKHPERVVYKAVERMISRNTLGRQQMRKLHVYAGKDHPHEAQKPKNLDIAAMNPKNKRSA